MVAMLLYISKFLFYCCIIANNAFVYIPQILKILAHKSANGLNVFSSELEVLGCTDLLAYCLCKGSPFFLYGVRFYLWLQAMLLLFTIYDCSQPGTTPRIWKMLYGLLRGMFVLWLIDPFLLIQALHDTHHAFFFLARVTQIWKNFKNGSTGELSFLTSLMHFGNSVVRVFILIWEKNPTSAVLLAVIPILTDGTILSQIIIYERLQEKKEKEREAGQQALLMHT